jgi:hypothetical protein
MEKALWFIAGMLTMLGIIYLLWKGGNMDNDPDYLSKKDKLE